MKIVLTIFGVVVLGLGFYAVRNLNYWKWSEARARRLMQEKTAQIAPGRLINYGEGPDNGPALLLIHGQTGAWDSYSNNFARLNKNWHVFAVDCYGHGASSHDPSLYSMKANGDDLLQFIREVIGEPTVVSGHSSGALQAAYVAAYGGEWVRGLLLEDPPVFSTEPGRFEQSFAYQDTYKAVHDYLQTDRSVPWEAYYLQNCLWGKMFMPGAMPGLAKTALAFKTAHPDEALSIWFLPPSLTGMFSGFPKYDLLYGEAFYNYSWQSGISHEKLFSEIKVPTVYLHALEEPSQNGILMAAASNEDARRAVGLMAQSVLFEEKSNHAIHVTKPAFFYKGLDYLRQWLDSGAAE